MGDEVIPFFPPFMSLDRVWQFSVDSNMYVGKYLNLFNLLLHDCHFKFEQYPY
jgi:hypothetical protein